MIWVRRVALAALVVVAVAAAGGYVFLRASLPKTTGEIRVAGLSAPVTITRDANGIPYIRAATQADAWYALGFVHAQDRLFQMEMVRRIGQGRLSELIGRAGLSTDRFMRIIGLEQQAEAGLRSMPPAARDRLEAYATGVNAYLTRGGPLPPEFLILRDRPEPWRPTDTLLWGRLMALQLAGNWREELQRAQLSTKLPPDYIAALWPNRPADAATTLSHLATLYRGLDLDRTMAALPPPLGPDRASNEWALSGQHTVSGRPLLVNDPHLALTAPGPWYLARIEAPGMTLTGATAPGVPAVVLGHNTRIAWGFTTTGADSFDLFIERPDPGDPTRYLTPDGSQPFATRTETIKIRGEPDETITARATRHGPVISDALPGGMPDTILALSFPAVYRPDTTATALFALDLARNWDEFLAALADWHAPMQNIVYADVDGNIGFAAPALLPRRKSGDGWLPRPGWTGEFDWDGFVPFDQLPHSLNPPSGRIVNANNRIVPNDYPVFITRDWFNSYRAVRINDLLDATPRQDPFSSESMLADSVSLFARDVIKRLDPVAARDDASRRALALLKVWDGGMRRDRPEPLIFSAWMRALMVALLHDGDRYNLDRLLRYRSAMLIAAFDGTSVFCKDRPGGCAAVVSDALKAALDTLATQLSGDLAFWRWDALHYARFPNQFLDRIPLIRSLVGFHVPVDGDFYTINRAGTQFADADAPYADVHGAAYRAIYDLSNLDDTRFIIAPGQSGNPLSPHWGDFVDAWAHGRYVRIGTAPPPGSDTLTLVPR